MLLSLHPHQRRSSGPALIIRSFGKLAIDPLLRLITRRKPGNHLGRHRRDDMDGRPTVLLLDDAIRKRILLSAHVDLHRVDLGEQATSAANALRNHLESPIDLDDVAGVGNESKVFAVEPLAFDVDRDEISGLVPARACAFMHGG